ncbi:hypothetical protein FKM82_003779 [Ascaphus truei]
MKTAKSETFIVHARHYLPKLFPITCKLTQEMHYKAQIPIKHQIKKQIHKKYIKLHIQKIPKFSIRVIFFPQCKCH